MVEKPYRKTAAAALGLSVLPLPLVVAVAVTDDLSLGGDLIWSVWIPAAFLSCVAGIVLGHLVLLRRPIPVRSAPETSRALAAIMVGYVCLLPTVCALPLVVALLEMPWLIFRYAGIELSTTIIAAILLMVSTIFCYEIGFFSAALIGTVELALLAGWIPFARRPGLEGRRLFALVSLLYGFTILSVVWGYLAWSSPRSHWYW